MSKPMSQQQLVRFQAAYPFRGDASTSQLSFDAGDIICVDTAKQSDGWVWGAHTVGKRRGWCPQSYLVLHQQPEPPVAYAFPVADDPAVSAYKWDYNADDNINDGFSGPMMGGSAGDSWASQDSPPEQTKPVSSGLSAFGSGIRNAGRSAVHGVAAGTKKAGEFAKSSAQETKYRVQEMRQQQRASHQNHQQPTKGQDIGNHAARGAVVHGAAGMVFGGVNGMKRGIARGGVLGGAHGAVKGWRPFG
ncbi:expressed unknown protein [Seminavis robusta]|uniref:SH3 domain-containing protein n=1 Tax=Seminavis robusta TaxID=568900 RepID=A0A9N8DEK0_9STRA|nr:expressed unknown protein [Seminavis robusta]|eukprot:Sro34_g021920.1 n/a (247) ;mRNA; f:48831-49571